MTLKGAVPLTGELSQLNDEEYVVAQSRLARGTEPAEAKSWMIFARMIFPKNMSIQYEAYLLEKEENKAGEAAKYLKILSENANKLKEPFNFRVEEELSLMVKALQKKDEVKHGQEKFLVEVFEQLPKQTRQDILLKAAYSTSDPISQSKQLLLAFERFHDLIPIHGAKFLDNILSLSKTIATVLTKVTPIMHLLVMEMCPKLLIHSNLKIETPVLIELLDSTVRFCCVMITSFQISKTPADSYMKGNSDTWKTIFTYVEEIGLRLGWTLTEGLCETSEEALFERLATFRHKQLRDPSKQEEFFYVTVLLFLKSYGEYVRSRESMGGSAVLVEAFVTHVTDNGQHHSGKRRRTEDENVPVITCGSKDCSHVQAFQQALNFYDLIQSSSLDSQFQQNYRNHTYFFGTFFADVAHHKGNFREALKIITALPLPQDNEKCGYFLKMATIQFCLSSHHAAADLLITAAKQAITAPSAADVSTARKGVSFNQQALNKSRHVHFLPTDKQSILSYCCRILVHLLKDSSLQSAMEDDLSIGHVIVLLQYTYPTELDLFHLLLHRISMKEKFSYQLFSSYVVHIEFLEEISSLVNDKKVSVAWDISSSLANAASSGASSRRMGTRGANKGETEEIKNIIRKQVARSGEDLDVLIVEFLTNSKDSILRCLI